MLIINDSPTAHTSTLKTAFNLINFTFLGSGILSIPYAFRLSGIFPGVSLLIIFALASFYAALIIKTIMDKHSISSFIEIGKRSFGAGGSLFTQFVFFLDLFFTACSYLVLISDSFVALYPDYNKDLVKLVIVPFSNLGLYSSTIYLV